MDRWIDPFNDVMFRITLSEQSTCTCVSVISWCNVTEQPLDVTANGYKHGVTKKTFGTAKAR